MPDGSARKNKGGRPRSEAARTTQIMVRLTPEEKARIHEIAGERGAAELMRSLALGRSPRIPRPVPELNREAWLELSRAASNLNQLAHRANVGEVVASHELEGALDECRQLLADVRRALLGGSIDGDR